MKKKDIDQKDKKKEDKKETKKDLLERIKKHKQDIQKIRFKLSGEMQEKGEGRKELRRAIAQAATKLTAIAKERAETEKKL